MILAKEFVPSAYGISQSWGTGISVNEFSAFLSPEYLLEGLMLKLKLQYFGHSFKDLTHWKRPWCWERLMAGGEGDDRGWDGWMASPTQWTWVWVSSGSWWWTGRPDMLQSMGSQRVGRDWAEMNWIEMGRFMNLSSSKYFLGIGTWFFPERCLWLSKGLCCLLSWSRLPAPVLCPEFLSGRTAGQWLYRLLTWSCRTDW